MGGAMGRAGNDVPGVGLAALQIAKLKGARVIATAGSREKRALVKDITDAVVKNFAVPVEAVTVEIVESEPTAKAKGGVLFSEMRR